MPNLRNSVYGWKSVWMELADESKGEFTESPDGHSKVRVPMAPWTITMEMHETPLKKHTRILLPFRPKSKFSFKVHNKNWREDAAKHFGHQDIIVGFDDFDHEYIIQADDEHKIKALLSNDTLRESIMLQRAVRLSLHHDSAKNFGKVPADVAVLAFEEDRAIDSFERLVSLLELKRAIMVQLCEIGIASEKQPDFVF